MSRVMQNRSSSVIGAARRQQRTGSALRRLAGVVTVWTLRRRTRKSLRRLDAHLLEDIGLTQADARNEAKRPFWQG